MSAGARQEEGAQHARSRWLQPSTETSWRRYARETMKETGATELDIDLYLGWNELIHHREMQLHYEGLQRGSRVRRARLLMMV